MVETASGVSFPVVFSDGECETNIGNVVVCPVMDFKSLQSILSQKVGISPHQFTVYLADQRSSRSPRRKIPVTRKSNFSSLSREKTRLFLVVLKRRRDRKRSNPKASVQHNRIQPPTNVMILKRNHVHDGIIDKHLLSIFGSGFGSPREDFERRVRNLQIEKERYLTNMGVGNMKLVGREGEDFMGERNLESDLVCEECVRGDPGFHRCVYDAVTSGFRTSKAGPIARPGKRSEYRFGETDDNSGWKGHTIEQLVYSIILFTI